MRRLLIKCREFYAFKHFVDLVFSILKMHFWIHKKIQVHVIDITV